MAFPIKGTNMVAENLSTAFSFARAVDRVMLDYLIQRSGSAMVAYARADAIKTVLESGQFKINEIEEEKK